jgi:hypothetical protein
VCKAVERFDTGKIAFSVLIGAVFQAEIEDIVVFVCAASNDAAGDAGDERRVGAACCVFLLSGRCGDGQHGSSSQQQR